MRIHYDQDEWETVTESRQCSRCRGNRAKCDGGCNGSFSVSSRRRAPEDVAKIKAERRKREEDDILAQAELIKLRRAPQ